MEITAFVEAEDENSALEVGHTALREEADNCWEADVRVREVTHRNWPRDISWSNSALVYGTSNDTTLGSWLATLPVREK
jgi:hypothetical protein